MRRGAELVLVAVLVAIVTWGVTDALRPAPDTTVAAQGYRVALAARANRIAATEAKAETVTVYVTRVREAVDSLAWGLAKARQALADSGATNAELRAQLADLIARAEAVEARVPLLTEAVSALIVTQRAERLASTEALAKADSVIAAERARAGLWKRRAVVFGVAAVLVPVLGLSLLVVL